MLFRSDPMGLWLGDGVEVKDDGEGCYLSDEFYAKNDAGEYTRLAPGLSIQTAMQVRSISGESAISASREKKISCVRRTHQ